MSNTPYLIETNTLVIQTQEEAWNQGLYQIGSDLWAFPTVVDQVTFDTTLGAYKSMDGVIGHAWSRQGGTGPLAQTISGDSGVSWFLDRVAGKMYAAYFSPTSLQISLANFTFAGTTWSAVVSGGPAPASPGGVPTILLQRTSTGDSLILYWDGTDTNLVVYSGGFGAPIAIGAGERLRSAVIDTADVLHIMTFIGPTSFKYRTFSGGVLSAATTAYTASNAQNEMGPGTYDSVADEVIFPLIDAAPPGQNLALLRGKPSAAPVWTYDAAGNTGAFDFFKFAKYLKIGTHDYAFTMNEVGSGTFHVQLVYFKKTGGAWGARQTLWDELADPGVPPAVVIDQLSLWSIGLLSDGTTIGMTLGLLPTGADVFCQEQYALVVNLVPPLTLACPLSNTGAVGAPYSGTLQAAGGVPPYTFTIIG